MRSSAQLIAYELPLGLDMLGVVLAAGSLNLNDDHRQPGRRLACGMCFAQPLGFIVFVIAAFAEAARLPFDLPEAEQELIGGYHTEYAGMKLMLFLVAEFLHMITASFLIVILFLGGWHFLVADRRRRRQHDHAGPWRSCGSSCCEPRSCCVIVFFMLVRWSWPRFRFDQLMKLAWKIMLPLGMVNLVALAVSLRIRHLLRSRTGQLATWTLGLAIAGWLVVCRRLAGNFVHSELHS